MTNATWTDRYYPSRDGLQLHYREYASPGRERAPPVLCIAGLTRNARDFETIAPRIAARRRVLCADLRGRGYSQHDPKWHNYHPGVYLEDLLRLLEHAGVGRLVLLGTSLGGILSMVLTSLQPERVAGVVLNDIGPEIAAEGRERIANYVGRHAPVRSWAEAIAQSKATYGLALPDFTDEQWLEHARRAYTEVDGVPRLDADPMIGEAVRAGAGSDAPNLWATFQALGPVPALAFRGASSDILTVETFDRMADVKQDLERVTVPNRGHTPQLDEPECVLALDAFLAKV